MQPHCWWTSQYVPVAAVWVAARFQAALVRDGYPNARWHRDADSAWAFAGPPGLSADKPAYGFRMVAFAAGDSAGCAWRGTADAPIARRPAGAQSCFHANVLIYAPTHGWAAPKDSDVASGGIIARCGDVYRDAIGDLARLR